MKSRRMRLGLFILIMILATISFAGSEKCSPENAKFKKSFNTITHSLLPKNVWRNEKEKELFFGCVEAEENFVENVIGKGQSIPIIINVPTTFGPDGVGTIYNGNRNLKIQPIEVSVEPGKEYVVALQYLGGTTFSAVIPYYSSAAITWIDTKTEIFSGSWDFHVQKDNTVYYPRYWDSMKFKVNYTYPNGGKVKKAFVRFMVISALMENADLSGFVVAEINQPIASHYIAEPKRDAIGIDKNGRFY